MKRLVVLKELGLFLWQNRCWWIAPIVIIVILLGALIFFTQNSSVVPFIYALF